MLIEQLRDITTLCVERAQGITGAEGYEICRHVRKMLGNPDNQTIGEDRINVVINMLKGDLGFVASN